MVMMLDVSSAEYERAREAGKEVSEPLHLSELVEPYSDRAWVGAGETRPTLYLDDVSELPFLDGILGVEEYQHRARVRANDRDLFAAVTSPAPGYEVYCRQRLALGSPDALGGGAGGRSHSGDAGVLAGRSLSRDRSEDTRERHRHPPLHEH